MEKRGWFGIDQMIAISERKASFRHLRAFTDSSCGLTAVDILHTGFHRLLVHPLRLSWRSRQKSTCNNKKQWLVRLVERTASSIHQTSK